MITKRNELTILKLLLIDKDTRGNKQCPCKIPDPYLRKQKSYSTFRTLATLAETGKKIANTRVFYNTKIQDPVLTVSLNFV